MYSFSMYQSFSMYEDEILEIANNSISYPTLQPSNITLFTSVPTCNITFHPTSIPSTFGPTQGEYHLVQDITNPAKFNFIAFILGLSFLFIIIGVTLTGIILRCFSKTYTDTSDVGNNNTLNRSRIEILEQYFIEDVNDQYQYDDYRHRHYNKQLNKAISHNINTNNTCYNSKYQLLTTFHSKSRLYQNTIPLAPTNIIEIRSSYSNN